ncbi:hypothetical protein G9A89_022340 [Geosiphon pyriformis]|nr:hypothetical protein G9A89_022340 [Geosiphon pyriformis]
MFKKTLAGLAFLACCFLTFAENTDVVSHVISLTKDTFHKVVAPEKLILVEFFAPWCGHCKALAPEYEKAAKALKEHNVKLAKVDCTAETELCQEYEVKGYPTLKVFREGNATDYNGGRKEDLIISYMKKQALPPVSDIDYEKLDSFKDSENVVIVGFFSEDSQEEYNTFVEVAENLRQEYLFGATGQKKAAIKAEVEPPVVVLYKKFDERNVTLKPPFDKEQLTTFIKTNSVPLLADIGPENYSSYVDSGLPLAFLFHENDEQKASLGKAIEPIALEFKGKVNFVYIDANKFGSHAANINLKEEWPAFGIQKPEEGLKYPYDQKKEITTENIRTFLEKFVKGEIPASIKSEPIPETNDEPVFVLVADSFEENAYDKTKDVLIEFYAPWCGHCKKLAPIYEKLGKAYQSFKDQILIAKMDATTNDLPSRVPFKISGFPTIKLFRAGDNEIIEYQGDRTYENFIEFLNTNGANKVQVNTTSSASESEAAVPPSVAPIPEESAEEQKHEEL